MAHVLLVAATDGGTSGDISAKTNRAVTLMANNLAGVETGDIQISHDGGTTFTDLYSNGQQMQLLAANTAVTVYGPGIYRVVKSATAGACGIYASTDMSL